MNECLCGHESYEHTKTRDGHDLEGRGACQIHGCDCTQFEERIVDEAGERADRRYDRERGK